MYEKERLRALEELMIALLRVNPLLLEELLQDTAHMPQMFEGDRSTMTEEQKREADEHREHLRLTHIAKAQLLRRARYPNGSAPDGEE